MKSPVTAHDALVQSPYFDRERPVLAATCIATLIGRLSRQHDIAVYRLHRCLRQITTLERWQEGANAGRSATRPPPEQPYGGRLT